MAAPPAEDALISVLLLGVYWPASPNLGGVSPLWMVVFRCRNATPLLAVARVIVHIRYVLYGANNH